jgi:AraC family transcriptional regulator of adaptative response/methylated-DNA-[protein]-cysteine methyltransferase
MLAATYTAGYGSSSRVYEQVTGGLGMTPSAYRAGGAGESIVYAVRETGFGALLMGEPAQAHRGNGGGDEGQRGGAGGGTLQHHIRRS